MPRKAFLADLGAAADTSIQSITSVTRGDDDGDVNFFFVPPSGCPIEIGLIATDVPGYPAESTYMLFTKSESCPPQVNTVLEKVSPLLSGKPILAMLQLVSSRLRKAFQQDSPEDPETMTSDEEMDIDELDEDYEDESDEELARFLGLATNVQPSFVFKGDKKAADLMNKRIRHDLREIKLANFKLGILSGMKATHATNLLSVSIRVSKLGLSDEALQAWDLESRQYIILLIQFSSGYETFDQVIARPAINSDVSFRIGFGNKYKPTLDEALAAFTDAPLTSNLSPLGVNGDAVNYGHCSGNAGFHSLFISSSLNQFMNTEFISLLKLRVAHSLGWDGAKECLDSQQGHLDKTSTQSGSSWSENLDETPNTLPAIIKDDYLQKSRNERDISFPVIATQFALRYLVRCTEFCLVCHVKLKSQFEALKPYVCSNPLCLYQYMSLGFGPSIEHEILTQPYVVDLLISFCYSSVLYRRIREYPMGMALTVPQIDTDMAYGPSTQARTWPGQHPTPVGLPGAADPSPKYHVRFDISIFQVIFRSDIKCPVHPGQWVVICYASVQRHYRVESTHKFPAVYLSDPASFEGSITCRPSAPHPLETPAVTPPPEPIVDVELFVYDKNFDTMDDDWKANTIAKILTTLPSIKEMRAYLQFQSRTASPKLASWKQRISPAALGILRWVIASNRSCIVQVDRFPGQHDLDPIKIRPDYRIANVSEEWVQFRFAQGAPDKEQRFLNSLEEQRVNLSPLHPTLFAWHGSAIGNWHSIIRQGLDFKETINGRAYGHGVYHAMDQDTSIAYSRDDYSYWPGSSLKITTAMSLNEIVNNPKAYQSSSPYLVVQHVDWIQCRYLFVKSSQTDAGNPYQLANLPGQPGNSATLAGSTDLNLVAAPAAQKTEYAAQDPRWGCKSTLRRVIRIPLSTLSAAKTFRNVSKENSKGKGKEKLPPKAKRAKLEPSDLGTPQGYTTDSDESDIEDVAFLISDVEIEDGEKSHMNKPAGSSQTKIQGNSKFTDFVPGTLKQASLPLLQPPSYATPTATMSLNRELQKILKIQKSTPLHELGWYIDQDLIGNLYQWIVELHSFDGELPVAKDMKAAGVTSIVLEIRFGKDFPHSPPFVRVIRPRFLPFTQGGGGHVTLGGAMCMELLTNSGWSAVNSIESVLLQVRLAIMNLEPQPARLEKTSMTSTRRDYGTGEAIEAYIRACRTHGWEVPKDFHNFGNASLLN